MKSFIGFASLLILVILLTVFARPLLQERAWGPERSVSPMMLALDEDQDGALSSQEMVNSTGRLDLVAYPDSAPAEWESARRVDPLYRAIDINGDNTIDPREVVSAPSQLKRLDFDGNGSLTLYEISRAAGWDQFADTQALPNRLLAWYLGYSPNKHLLHIWGQMLKALPSLYNTSDSEAFANSQSSQLTGFLLYRVTNLANGLELADETRLVDPQGIVVGRWDNWRLHASPGISSKLLADGSLLRTYTKHDWIVAQQPGQLPAGAWSRINVLHPDGGVYWQYEDCQVAMRCLRGDVEVLPNGNFLVLASERLDATAAAQIGWPTKDNQTYWFDQILELQPNYEDGSTKIVWQWDIRDHLVQDHNSALASFGDVAASFGKLDSGYAAAQELRSSGDSALGITSIDYHPQRKQILLNSSLTGELYIINHALTTEQAAGDAGDFIWRWGNPQAYRAGDELARTLYQQHSAQWLNELPGAGDIMVFNNGTRRPGTGADLINSDLFAASGPPFGLGRNYSEVIDIELLASESDRYERNAAGAYALSRPAHVVKLDAALYNPLGGKAQRLPDGNTLVAQPHRNVIYEVSAGGQLVTAHKVKGMGQVSSAEKFAIDHPAITAILSSIKPTGDGDNE